MINPYNGLPDHCFWSRAHRVSKQKEIDPVVMGAFTLTPEMKIATAGSCFAQHIAKHLVKNGYNYFIAEKAHPVLPDVVAKENGFGVFSARYGNLYTVRQLLQLVQRAYGQFRPEEDVWEVDGALVDPFRPNIQPKGFISEEEFQSQRETHFAAVRAIVEKADVFVFTFGLTEGWISKKDGAVFPLAPGVAGGSYDPEIHEFKNFEVTEIVDDFKAFVEFARVKNPNLKIIMTVSPVPLIATAREDQSVITATSYSKAVLRVATETLARDLDNCVYFPSYEVITGNFSGGSYYEEDLREVRDQGVQHVMSLFMKHYTDDSAVNEVLDMAVDDVVNFVDSVEKELDIICDEQRIAQSVDGK